MLQAEIKRARKTSHSTAQQAAKVAQVANVRKLLLGHFSARYDDNSLFEKEAKIIFENVSVAKEGMRIIATQNEIDIQQ